MIGSALSLADKVRSKMKATSAYKLDRVVGYIIVAMVIALFAYAIFSRSGG